MQSLSDPDAVAGMARYGIVSKNVLGISVVKLRSIAKEIGKDHRLAQQLWKTGILDARFLAIFIDEPDSVTEAQMERWAKDFDNWAICDGCCLHLFDRTSFAWKKAIAWSNRREEFVRRAAFTLMAVLTVHDKNAHVKEFVRLLPRIKKAAPDERNGVKKAVNWALRQIGKRNLPLNKLAIATAHQIKKMESSSARWIASDALRELTSPAVAKRLKKKG
ncbi:MAG TPA: DNA alkylation repair protein [Saprospiraceae bacterium]|nr:DNA alkylation repair protein [Saprospiraceae bacterium]